MSSKPKGNTFALIFVVIGIIVFQIVAPKIFGDRPGVDWNRAMWAAIVGGGLGGLGYVVGSLLDKKQ